MKTCLKGQVSTATLIGTAFTCAADKNCWVSELGPIGRACVSECLPALSGAFDDERVYRPRDCVCFRHPCNCDDDEKKRLGKFGKKVKSFAQNQGKKYLNQLKEKYIGQDDDELFGKSKKVKCMKTCLKGAVSTVDLISTALQCKKDR